MIRALASFDIASVALRVRCSRHAPFAALSLAAAAGVLAIEPAGAAWPERPVKLVVAVAAGGPTDDLARIMANGLGEILAGSFFVENRGGGGGRIGIGAVARADPDGYTLLVAASSLTISAAMSSTLPYDPVTDFAPIAMIATTPTSFTVSPKLGVDSIKSLVELSKRQPEALNYATPGTGTVGHLAAEMLKIRSGLAMLHVAHTGAGPAVQSLLAGSVQVLATPVPAVQAQIAAGNARSLAVTSEKRWSKLPDVPTMVEQGFEGFVADTFFGLLAPAATPREIVVRLTQASLDILARPETVARLQQAGYDVAAKGPDELARRIRHEIPLWRGVATQAGLSVK